MRIEQIAESSHFLELKARDHIGVDLRVGRVMCVGGLPRRAADRQEAPREIVFKRRYGEKRFGGLGSARSALRISAGVKTVFECHRCRSFRR